MSRPLFLTGELPADGPFRLDGLRGARAARARGLRPGDPVLLGDGQGTTATARVTAALAGDRLELMVGGRTTVPRPGPGLAVVQAIDTADRDALAVAELTELGADEISVLATPEVLAALAARRAARFTRWHAVARDAAERSGRVWLPKISFLYNDISLLRRFEWGATGFVLDPGAATRLSTVDVSGTAQTVLVVGGECLGPSQIDALTANWVIPVSNGAHLADTRAAAAAATAVLAARLRPG